MKQINEGKARLNISTGKISKKLPVFYNPDMELNRSISIALLNSVSNKDMQIALPLAGSGIRGIRFLLELKKSKIKNIGFNDMNQKAIDSIKTNLELNKIKISDKINIHNKDANLFILESNGFDYVDIDPFGSPNFLLDSACKRMARGGILAVTATDTGALAGTFKAAGIRKYWAKPMKNELMHETALRILIRKVQLIAAQYEKALIPIYCHATLHYDRVYFKVEKGRQKADALLKEHKYILYCDKCMERKVSEYNLSVCSCGNKFSYAGPLWAGKLWDPKLALKMAKDSHVKLLNIISNESKINSIGFYDIHKLAKLYGFAIPRIDLLVDMVIKKGYKASRTHFSGYSIRSDIGLKQLVELLT